MSEKSDFKMQQGAFSNKNSGGEREKESGHHFITM